MYGFVWKTHWKEGTVMAFFKRRRGDDRMIPVQVIPLITESVEAMALRLANDLATASSVLTDHIRVCEKHPPLRLVERGPKWKAMNP